MTAAIRTENLVKKFKDLTAVDGVSLEIDDGECFGLLGPNGAGKTSLIRMLTAVSPPTSGQIWVSGQDLAKNPREVKARLGVVPQVDNLDPDLKVRQNLMTFARYFGIPRREAERRSREVLQLFQLEEKQDNHLKELSGGMKRRLLIARGMINQPRLVILDEPSIGLDPQSRHLVWQKLRELRSQGVTLLLCTQNMEEAAALSDRVAIMHQGKVLALDTPRKLITGHVGSQIWEIEPSKGERDIIVGELEARRLEYEETGSLILVFHTGEKTAAGLPGRARPATLEDVFFRLTGRSLVE